MTRVIYVNGRFLTQPMTGVQRYAHELLNNFDLLLEQDSWNKRVEICCLVPPKSDLAVHSPWKNISIRSIGINRGNLWEQWDLPVYLKDKFIFSPTNSGPLLYRNQAITMHDASVFAVPHAYSIPFRFKHRLIFRSLSRRARIIFTDSGFSRNELSHYLGQSIERYRVVHLAGDHLHRIDADPGILDRHGLKRNEYVLTVASHSPHKNLQAAKEAAKLIKSNVKMVFAGGEYNRVFNKETGPSSSERTIFIGHINDRELKALYSLALAYVFPSHYEGFGIPLLEALECRCPVLCSRAASLPEVAGEAALYFDPMIPAEIANLVDVIHDNHELRNELIARGNTRLDAFSWQKTALQTLSMLMAAIPS
jgi:glycosyltransferase involved in cell wall biosynthesis